MKQILQSLKSGEVRVEEVPAPRVGRSELLVETTLTLVSTGTERMLVEFGKSGWIGKARRQPDKVREVLRKARNDGIGPTLEAVRNKLDQPLPLGYCNVGRVIETGTAATGFRVGQRVVSNGKHAGIVAVPANLAAAVPEGVSDEEAALTVIGAIALEGIRLASPTLGECVVVSGLGLIGLVAVQLLVANGCRVLGLDFAADRLELAKSFGAEVYDLSAGEPLVAAERFSRGRGVDAVIVAASTSSSDPIRQAAEMSRKRGRIVLVGVTGLELSRADFYEKELSFQVSCSYGPGRYDAAYEAGGQDYPHAFVRWTAQRNFEAVLDMMAAGRIDMKPLVSHRFPIERAEEAYALVAGSGASLGIVLEFGAERDERRPGPAATAGDEAARPQGVDPLQVSFIGAGGYAGSTLIPAFLRAGASLAAVVSASGVSALHASRKFGFARAETDADAAIGRGDAGTIVVATRHDSHARMAVAALRAGRNVFVEKPLALREEDVDAIEQAWREGQFPQLMVGFNRRFSKLTQAMKAALDRRGAAKTMLLTVNAGAIPADHWTQDLSVGGGRILGEGVHFIDLARHLAGSPIESFTVASMLSPASDTACIQLRFANGDIASIAYMANGSKDMAKERVEVFCGGAVYAIHNWRKLQVFGDAATRPMRLWGQDKGQAAMAQAFLAAARGEAPPAIAPAEVFEVARAAIAIATAARHAG